MKPPPTIESINVRRTRLADADKVRYRVYSTPTEFIAVIAESALMAVKVSGISKPHKIVRDLPTEGVAVEAKRMAAVTDERVTLSTTAQPAKSALRTELAPAQAKEVPFEAMGIADLQRKGVPRARILPPELINQIIEDHKASSAPPVPEATAPVEIAMPTTAPAATPEEEALREPAAPAAAMPEVSAPEMPEAATQVAEPLTEVTQLPPPPPVSSEEKLVAMAQEMFQAPIEPAAPATPRPMATKPIKPPGEDVELSPEEVEKLLNG